MIISVLHKRYIKFQATINVVLQDNAAKMTKTTFKHYTLIFDRGYRSNPCPTSALFCRHNMPVSINIYSLKITTLNALLQSLLISNVPQDPNSYH